MVVGKKLAGGKHCMLGGVMYLGVLGGCVNIAVRGNCLPSLVKRYNFGVPW